MRELLNDMDRWQSEGKPIGLATVVGKTGSSLRPLGAKMAFTDAQEIAGSVSGGCVEGAVYEEGQEVLQSGQPRLLHYGVTDEMAWSVGLSCGGSIQVFVESLASAPVQQTHAALRECIRQGELVALATVVSGAGANGGRMLIWPSGRRLGSLGDEELDRRVCDAMLGNFTSVDARRVTLSSSEGEVDVYIEVYPPAPRMIIVGAVHIAIPLVRLSQTLGFRTVVVDVRKAFATRQRFPDCDELMVEWPADALQNMSLDEGCSIVFLSHDEKQDVPALKVALASRAGYIGALGSRKTHAKRLVALREIGVPDEQLGRIHAPVGLNLGGTYPEEIALEVMAEIVAARHGREVKP